MPPGPSTGGEEGVPGSPHAAPGAVGLASAVSDSCQHIVFTGHCRRPDGDADVFRATDGRAEAVHCFLNVLSSI